VVGESLIDLIRRPGEPELARVGGSPLNVSVGLSRLDVPSALWTRFGSDEHGALIADHLATNEVALVPGSVTSSPTSTAAAHIQEDGSARYEFDLVWELEPVIGLEPVLVHTGSIAALLEPGAGVVRDLVSQLRSRATVSYDPNVRPQLIGERQDATARVESFLALTDVVKASVEDLAWLYPEQHVRDVARRWLRLGPAVVVVTQGEVGAFAVTTRVVSSVPARAVEVVDTIGAGDSFMAGLLAALDDLGLLGREHEAALRSITVADLEQVLTFAARCAAITVSRPGADPPLRASVMEAFDA
jgi:fructokinase